MFQWIAANIWTFIICAVLVGIVTAIIISLVIKKRKGKSMVCNRESCSPCPMSGKCKR